MEVAESGGWDFLNWLGPDTSACVFHRLDDPIDLARAAAVSRSWRQFGTPVVTSVQLLSSPLGLDSATLCSDRQRICKTLCLGICPEVASFTRAAEVSESPQVPALAAPASGSGSSHDAEKLHRIYSNLGGALVSSEPSVDCIGASSTDRFPDERMENTLDPREMVGHLPSYWSSGGQYDPDVPESLTYRLHSNLSIVDEIRIQPYQEYFYDGQPIFSSKMVRVRIGRSRSKPYSWSKVDNQTVIADEDYVWTYTSPDIPMRQENVLQSFKLPRPVLCIGGVVRIELLGRTNKAADDMYYICVCHAQVIGRSLSPVFKAHISDSAGGTIILKYLPGAKK